MVFKKKIDDRMSNESPAGRSCFPQTMLQVDILQFLFGVASNSCSFIKNVIVLLASRTELVTRS